LVGEIRNLQRINLLEVELLRFDTLRITSEPDEGDQDITVPKHVNKPL
jgi:hypothetical protein